MTSRTALTPAPASARHHKPHARARRKPRTDLRVALIFIAPAAIGFLAFYLWPALRGLYFSLTEYAIFNEPTFVGLQNFQHMVSDEVFWNALKVTVEYVAINIGVQTIVAVGLAVLMHRLTRSIAVRGVLLLPYLIANVIVALIWFWMLDYNVGIVNVALEWIGDTFPWTGVSKTAFFGDSVWAIPTIALVNTWRHMGYTALLIFAGLLMIPPQLYEAAAIDGAGELRTFRSITLPLLRPVLAMVLVITVTGSFQVFDTVAVTTAGGPANASKVLYFYIFEEAFTKARFGYASAMAVVLFAILAVISYLQIKLMRAGESDLA